MSSWPSDMMISRVELMRQIVKLLIKKALPLGLGKGFFGVKLRLKAWDLFIAFKTFF